MKQHNHLYPVEVKEQDAPSLTDYVRAVVNILEDFGEEKQRLETTQKAVLNILEDLEDEKQSAQAANRMKSEFLANMSHELRTPLNSIIGFSELMSDGKVGPIADNHKEYLGDILTSARHLLQLINDVLDLAKVEAGKLEFESKPVDIHKLIFGIRDTLRSIASSRNIQVEVQVTQDLIQVIGDPARLKQVLYNYLSNALKFTPEGGRVVVTAERHEGDFFKISVSDTGNGIAPEHLSRLFVEFEQLDASIGKRHQGTGLGLALTKRIVEAQGGHIGVESILGEGSQFYAVLPTSPRIERLDSSVDVIHGVDSDQYVLKALVVESDQIERDYIVNELSNRGFETVVVNEMQTLKSINQLRFDLIILALDLSHTGAHELLAEIRKNPINKNTSILVVSALTDNFITPLPEKVEIIKPLARDKLLAAIKHNLAIAAQVRHIMLVDDEENDLKLMQKHLHDAGYFTVSYCQAEEALAALSVYRPNAIILDLVMPGIGGVEMLKHLETHPDAAYIPIIVWSEKDYTHDMREYDFQFASALMRKADGHERLIKELTQLLIRK
jgi:signal transduction histidine kinase/CheY-like chemotaxis protein